MLSLAGAAVSVALVRRHLAFLAGSEDSGVCSLIPGADCAAIEASRFSEILGVPTAAFGAFHFFALALLAWFGWRGNDETEKRPDFEAIAALFTLAGLAASVVLAAISAVVIRAFCPFCAVVYFITLAAALVGASRGVAEYLADAMAGIPALGRLLASFFVPRRALGLFVSLALPLATLALPAYLSDRARDSFKKAELPAATNADETEKLLRTYFESPPVELQFGERALARGEASAPLQIVIFTDFECQYCRRFHRAIKPVLDKYEGRFRLIYKHYPFSAECNPALQGQKMNHPHACRLAEMAQALGAMGRFWPAGEELYEIQTENLNPALTGLAQKAGIDFREWVGHLSDPAVREQVKADITEGLRLRVVEVPTIYVNGRALKSIKPANVEKVLQAALEKNPPAPK